MSGLAVLKEYGKEYNYMSFEAKSLIEVHDSDALQIGCEG